MVGMLAQRSITTNMSTNGVKNTTACMNHGYRTASCPNCGAPMPYLTSKSKTSDKVVEYARSNMMYCQECETASPDDKWVINKFN